MVDTEERGPHIRCVECHGMVSWWHPAAEHAKAECSACGWGTRGVNVSDAKLNARAAGLAEVEGGTPRAERLHGVRRLPCCNCDEPIQVHMLTASAKLEVFRGSCSACDITIEVRLAY